jgi:hypothetical protein
VTGQEEKVKSYNRYGFPGTTTQRTDSTHILAAIRTLHRLECVQEAMHAALNQLSAAAPEWVQQRVARE